MRDVKNREKSPPAERQRQMQELLHGSFLAPKIAGAHGKVLDGMSTYFLKLGPDNLGEAMQGTLTGSSRAPFPASPTGCGSRTWRAS